MGVEADRARGLKGAFGLKHIKKGFCFEPTHDELFALGWPHIRVLTDVHVEPYKLALYHLMQTDFDLRITWPRSLALALVRAWGIGRLYDIAPGKREIRDEVKEALWNLEPMETEEVTSLIQTRMETTPLWVGDRATESFVLLAEALTSAETIAEAILTALERMGPEDLIDMKPMPALITYQLGYLFLRVPAKAKESLERRLQTILHHNADLAPGSGTRLPQTPCHARSMMLVLQKAKAAHATTDHDLRWYTHSEDPVPVRMRASINRGFTLPDARLVWIGGPRILEARFGGWYRKLDSTDQKWFLEQMGPVKAVELIPIMLSLATESTVRPHARNWLLNHRDFAMPVVERLASVSNPHAADAKKFLASLDDA